MPTSNELLNRHFEKANFGGYKAADVDKYTDDVKVYISEASKEIAELKRKLSEVEKKAAEFSQHEDSIKNTLLNAQVLADKITKEAKDEADKILSDANAEAESKTRSAKIKVENLIDCAQSEVEMRKNEAETIKTEVYNFKLSLMKLYKAQLELINEIPAEEPKPAKAEKEPEPEEVSLEETQIEQTESESDSKSQEKDNVSEVEEKTDEKADEDSTETDDGLNKNDEEVSPVLKTDSKEIVASDEPVTEDSQSEETPIKNNDEEKAKAEAAATQPTVRLNLRYNEKTGEYEPLGKTSVSDTTAGLFSFKKGNNGDGLKFGADYNISTDSFEHKNR